MSDHGSARWFTLVQRELQEYRVSLVWTPLVLAGALAVLMLAGVLVANQFSNLGQIMLQAVMQEESSEGLNLKIGVVVNGNGKQVTVVATETGAESAALDGPVREDYQIEAAPELADEQLWDFSADWTFSPVVPVAADGKGNGAAPVDSLNPLLHGVHVFMLLILVFVSFNYLLGCLYHDRKDRSILFWRSMPVSVRDEVLAKLAVALLVAPAIFIAASLLAQLATVLLAMLLVLRMDLDPFAVVLSHIQFGRLLLDQLGGWLLTSLWVLPVYAWVLLASAGARRSPFMLALTPVLGLVLLEALLLGSSHFGSAVMNHLPHYDSGRSAVGFYLLGPDWANLDFLGLVLGLLAGTVLLAATMWLRRYRWEI
ncbi:ABC-2 transporter permease [Haliea sp. E1-2-M8]|uniref:ABC-2 transporter permease n=1 Tax=Haliea sp. E1-2-M8 TaxID=3064706 RepID=UPI00271C02E5|nr:ABC-2 transporter permease [Haliea sp. E1-2-M8]MDO8862133.1 ABC-2 transporter permease [Haliea sp. E1-2-M8]